MHGERVCLLNREGRVKAEQQMVLKHSLASHTYANLYICITNTGKESDRPKFIWSISHNHSHMKNLLLKFEVLLRQL